MLASGDFWNRRSPEQWSVDDVQKLLHDSPWAKTINADFFSDIDPATPTIGRGGIIGAPQGPSRRREPVQVIWESGQPVLDARRAIVPARFSGRYVISAGEIPMGAMDRKRRPSDADAGVPETPAERRKRMLEQLAGSATLEARGKPPVQPGVVEPSPRLAATWVFGFSRELLEIDADDREVVFSVATAFITLRASFEPRKMLYRNSLSL